MNLRDRIITAAKSPHRLVKASLCGETVYVRSLTLAELDEYTRAIKPLDDDKDKHRVNLMLVSAMARDEHGERLYPAAWVDAGELDCLPAPDVHAFVDQCVGIINKPMEAVRKNSEATPEGSSASGSPVI
jgi:hypothetical protein